MNFKKGWSIAKEPLVANQNARKKYLKTKIVYKMREIIISYVSKKIFVGL